MTPDLWRRQICGLVWRWQLEQEGRSFPDDQAGFALCGVSCCQV